MLINFETSCFLCKDAESIADICGYEFNVICKINPQLITFVLFAETVR